MGFRPSVSSPQIATNEVQSSPRFLLLVEIREWGNHAAFLAATTRANGLFDWRPISIAPAAVRHLRLPDPGGGVGWGCRRTGRKACCYRVKCQMTCPSSGFRKTRRGAFPARAKFLFCGGHWSWLGAVPCVVVYTQPFPFCMLLLHTGASSNHGLNRGSPIRGSPTE